MLVGSQDLSDCSETVQHFLLECPLYEEERDQLLKNLFSQLGINYLDMDQITTTTNMDLLLGYSRVLHQVECLGVLGTQL